MKHQSVFDNKYQILHTLKSIVKQQDWQNLELELHHENKISIEFRTGLDTLTANPEYVKEILTNLEISDIFDLEYCSPSNLKP